MVAELPPPPVPADADLRGMDFMPLKGDRLFNSATWIEASNEGRVAALRQWWHAFAKEVPAGSLPDNDRLLAVYAGYGEAAIKAWRKIRPEAMKGWFKCSDGRLYHKFLAEIVCEAWDKRLDYRGEQDAKAERQRRWRERLKRLTGLLRAKGFTVPRGTKMETLEKMCRDADVDVSEPENDAAVDVYRDAGEIGKTGTGNRQGQGQGKEVKGKDEAEASSGSAAADRPASQAAMARQELLEATFAMWLPVAHELGIGDPGFANGERRIAQGKILDEIPSIEVWQIALQKLREAEFLRHPDGRPKRFVNFAWFCDPEHFTGLLEDRYRDRDAERPTRGPSHSRSIYEGAMSMAGKQPLRGILDP